MHMGKIGVFCLQDKEHKREELCFVSYSSSVLKYLILSNLWCVCVCVSVIIAVEVFL